VVSCAAVGVASESPVDMAFSPGTRAYLTATNYHQVDASNIIQTVTPMRIMHGLTLLLQVP